MGKRILKIVLAVVALVIGLSNPKVFIEFPLGLIATISLLASSQDGNTAALLGELIGDGTVFAFHAVLLYAAYRLLRSSPAKSSDESPQADV